jgi:hypothetical protein
VFKYLSRHECTRYALFVFIFVGTGLARRADPRPTSSVERLKDAFLQKWSMNLNRPEGLMSETEER